MARVASMSSQAHTWDEIVQTARTYQYDRYLAATLSPRIARDDLIVLAAFAGEMDRVPWSTSEPTIGAIRLQWWRDALSAGNARSSGNPLADWLAIVIDRHQLPVAQLIAYIDAQELELFSDPVTDLEQLKLHFAKRDGTLFALSARILGSRAPGERHGVVVGAAETYGLAKTLTEFFIRQRGRQLLLPGDHMMAAGIDPADPGGANRTTIKALLGPLIDHATELHETQKPTRLDLDRATRTALLPAALTAVYLDHAGRQLDAAKPLETGPTPLLRAWRMLLAHLRGRI